MNRDTLSMIRMIPLLLMLLVSIGIASGLFGDHDKPFKNAPLVGYDIVPFNVSTLGASQPRFAPQDWHGKVVVLNVFASWCEPCQEEHKIWMNLAQKRKVNIYGLAWKDSPEKVSAWLNSKGNPYQLIGVDQNGITTIPLALTGVPETFVLGPTGSIFFHQQAPVTQELVDNVIAPLAEKLANGEVVAAPRTTEEQPLPMVLTTPVNEKGEPVASNKMQMPAELPGPKSADIPPPPVQNVIRAPEGQPVPQLQPAPAAPNAR